MPIGLIFWVIMLLVILGKVAVWRGVTGPYVPYVSLASEWVILVLLFLLGWHVFGFIVRG